MKKYILILALVINAGAAEVPISFFRAVHQVETSGRLGAIKGDNGRAFGPFQIHKSYWKDAVQFDKTIEGKYEDCANYHYSVQVVRAYLNRYAKAAVQDYDMETLARIHNGGPTGHKKAATKVYWDKVEKALLGR